ncbi:MAG: hypothetical protein AB3N18_01975 [Allomuricauda sp.]
MINRLQFSIDIKAEKAKIWKALWDENYYQDWVGVFFEGSYAITDNWKENSRVLFLVPDKSGIHSIIKKHVPNKTMSFKHIGNVLNGEVQPLDDEAKKWSGATETYTLTEEKNCTKLTVEIDVLDEHLDFMKDKFPKALEKVKNNCN